MTHISRLSASGNKMATMVLHSRFRSKAVGDASIPTADRVYLEVHFPSSSSKPAPVHMYFKKTASVGRLIDDIAERGRIKNNNDRDISNPLQLYDLTTGRPLNPDLTVGKTSLPPHAPVLLEYQRQVDASCTSRGALAPESSFGRSTPVLSQA